MKLSENVTKYIEIIALKLKKNTIYIQRDIDIFSKYFSAAHESKIAKKIFQNFIHYSMRYCNLLKRNQLNAM